MPDRWLHSRLSNRSDGPNDAESLYWGIRWEGLLGRWLSRIGRWAEAKKTLARLSYLE